MIEVTSAFKNAMRAPVKLIQATVAVDGGSTYASSDSLMKVELKSSGYYFGVATKTVTFKLLGTDYNLLNQLCDITLSVQTDSANDTWADCALGRFKIVEQTVDLEKGVTSLTAYDAIGVMALKQYVGGELDFPTTISNLASRVAADNGMAYEEQELVNGTYQIAEDLYANINGITYRDILAEIAGATASLAAVSGFDSTLTFTEPKQTVDEAWTYDNLKKIKYEPQYGVANAVVLARTPAEDNIAVRDDESIAENGLTEVKLANNEILDDDRESLAQPILDAVDGFYFYPFEATTEGHGWHEVGDRISVTDGTSTWELIITDIALTIDGGLKEVVKGVAPDESKTNYALAGGITKTIYNTEIKVDKQGQEITSVVSRQDSFESQTLENFSQITQNISSVVTTIQTTGGSNMLHNSVGYNIDTDGNLVNWTKTGTITAESSPESVSYGALSGNQIDLAASSSITQRVTVSPDLLYTLSFRVKKNVSGTATVRLTNGTDNYSLTIPANESQLWKDFSIVGVKPSESYFDVIITTDSSITLFAITDLMLATGDSVVPWVSAADEILSKQVAIDQNGVKVSSSTNDDYVQLDEYGLNGYHNGENVLTLQQDVTEVAKLKSRDQITMVPIKIVPITTGSNTGWAFVATEE